MGLATSFSDPCFMNFRVRPVQIAAMRKAVGEIRKSGLVGYLSIYKVFGTISIRRNTSVGPK